MANQYPFRPGSHREHSSSLPPRRLLSPPHPPLSRLCGVGQQSLFLVGRRCRSGRLWLLLRASCVYLSLAPTLSPCLSYLISLQGPRSPWLSLAQTQAPYTFSLAPSPTNPRLKL